MESMSFSVSAHSTFGLQFKYSLLGEVVENYELVKKIESFGSQSGTTTKVITIVQSGTL